MFPNRLRDQEEEPSMRASIRKLVAYLSHAQKDQHLKTVLTLVSELDRFEGRASAQQINQATDSYGPPKDRVEIPPTARKVTFEL